MTARARVSIVQICPPGRALGAGDLHEWSRRRAAGLSGAGLDRSKPAKPDKLDAAAAFLSRHGYDAFTGARPRRHRRK